MDKGKTSVAVGEEYFLDAADWVLVVFVVLRGSSRECGRENHTTSHPECKYVTCDRDIYPTIGNIVHDVSGFKVDLVIYD